MADNSGSKKKVMVISMLAFLLAGGGVFLFFILQGADDLKGDKNKNFSYGNVIRDGVSPFFKAIGLMGDDDEMLAKAAKDRRMARDPESFKKGVDVSDWMDKTAAAPAGSASATAGGRTSASAQAPTSVPRMSGGGMGGIAGGGGGSKSSGGLSSYGGSSGKGNTSISASASGGSGAQAKGLVNSLRAMQSNLNSGLRSGSAMTAKSKWDKSFGVGSTGKGGGGDMAYKNGLVGLDKIKSGEIENLKTTQGGLSGSVPKTSVPSLEKDAANKAAEDKSKNDVASALTDAVKKSLGDGVSKLTGGGKTDTGGTSTGVDGGAGTNSPPPEALVNAAQQVRKEGGRYCPDGCETLEGATFKDSEPGYVKTENGWNVVYSGTQTNKDGSVVHYQDVYAMDKNGDFTYQKCYEGSKPDKLNEVPEDTAE